eukprot:3937271-Rhodomonas_salina.2
MFAVVFTLCLISTVLSTRRFSHLIELAPVVKEAGQRLMLVKAGVFFARELVLADHFSRMSQQVRLRLSHYPPNPTVTTAPYPPHLTARFPRFSADAMLQKRSRC